MAKLMIDGIKDDYFLFTQVLLRRWHSSGMFANVRYTNVANGKHTVPTSVVERAVDFDMIHVLGSHNFQRCISAIWRGNVQIQYFEDNSHIAIPYRHIAS